MRSGHFLEGVTPSLYCAVCRNPTSDQETSLELTTSMASLEPKSSNFGQPRAKK